MVERRQSAREAGATLPIGSGRGRRRAASEQVADDLTHGSVPAQRNGLGPCYAPQAAFWGVLTARAGPTLRFGVIQPDQPAFRIAVLGVKYKKNCYKMRRIDAVQNRTVPRPRQVGIWRTGSGHQSAFGRSGPMKSAGPLRSCACHRTRRSTGRPRDSRVPRPNR